MKPHVDSVKSGWARAGFFCRTCEVDTPSSRQVGIAIEKGPQEPERNNSPLKHRQDLLMTQILTTGAKVWH